MWFLRHVLLFLVVLPLALAGYIPPAVGTTCAVGSYRCDNNTLHWCGEDVKWKTIKQCSNTAYCTTNSTARGTGGCLPTIAGVAKQCSIVGAQRCDNNTLLTCGNDGYWKTAMECTKTAHCFAQANVKGGGACHALVQGDTQCSVANTNRCNENTLEVCGSHGYWKTDKECTKTAYCFAQANMADGGDCHPLIGDLEQCSVANVHRCSEYKLHPILQVCSDSGYWQRVKICAKSDRCVTGSIFAEGGFCYPFGDNQDSSNPNGTEPYVPTNYTYALPPSVAARKSKRDEWTTQCNPGDLACDKERRFLFTCGKDGMWTTEPMQCFGPGYCRVGNSYPLTCAGFPRYSGDDGTCNMHCETMDYLYCIGVSSCSWFE
jgi:hypothetical protein